MTWLYNYVIIQLINGYITINTIYGRRSKTMSSTKKNVTKGFKPETVKKIVGKLNESIKLYNKYLEDGEKIKLVISSGNSKIGRCLNVSLAPIITCGNCKECKCFCYDVKACLQYKNVVAARAKNTALFRYDRKNFFDQLWQRMEHKKTNKFLRFHVSGEIVDINHIEYIIETAKRFPDFTIWTYTKMYWLVNEYIRQHGNNKNCIPTNLTIMFSEWKGLPMDNPYNMPVFRCVYPEEKAPKGCMKCPGNCDKCKSKNIGCVNGCSVYTYLH